MNQKSYVCTIELPIEKVFVELYFKFMSIKPPSLRLVLLPKRINALESYIALTKLELLFELVKSKKVLIVGGCYSASDIASNLVGHAKEIVNIFRRFC